MLSDRLGFSASGGVWVKDETGNVSGSHKGRHLMGLLIHLEVAERLGLADRGDRPTWPSRAAGTRPSPRPSWPGPAGAGFGVFVPADADAGVVARLRGLGSERRGLPAPSRAGPAIPPTCGCARSSRRARCPSPARATRTGWRSRAARRSLTRSRRTWRAAGLDHIVIQVGGGALASACAQGLREAAELGAIAGEPRLHTVQTTGAHPLERAYARVRAMLPGAAVQASAANAGPLPPRRVERVLTSAAQHRSAYMWPWESEPKSIATGILDDETYDWRAVVGAMLTTGGQPLVVTEDRLAEANELAAATGIPADPTGSAGLAGLLDLRQAGVVGADERAVVLFTGVRRG